MKRMSTSGTVRVYGGGGREVGGEAVEGADGMPVTMGVASGTEFMLHGEGLISSSLDSNTGRSATFSILMLPFLSGLETICMPPR